MELARIVRYTLSMSVLTRALDVRKLPTRRMPQLSETPVTALSDGLPP